MQNHIPAEEIPISPSRIEGHRADGRIRVQSCLVYLLIVIDQTIATFV